jgi:hypothetical protein
MLFLLQQADFKFWRIFQLSNQTKQSKRARQASSILSLITPNATTLFA